MGTAIDLQARSKTQSCGILYALQDCVSLLSSSLHGSSVVLGDIQFKLGFGIARGSLCPGVNVAKTKEVT